LGFAFGSNFRPGAPQLGIWEIAVGDSSVIKRLLQMRKERGVAVIAPGIEISVSFFFFFDWGVVFDRGGFWWGKRGINEYC